MKKKILITMLMIACFVGGCGVASSVTVVEAGGGKSWFDTTYTFDRAIIQLANGEIVETKIKSWKDYEGEQLQIVAKDGTVYLTSSFRADLIKNK